MPERTAEKHRLHAAVDLFAKKMKKRLDEKVDEGCAGWDNPNNTLDIANTAYVDVDNMLSIIESSEASGPVEEQLAIDIANRCMMIERL